MHECRLDDWNGMVTGRFSLGIGTQSLRTGAWFYGFAVGVAMFVPLPVVVHVPRDTLHPVHVPIAANECIH